MRVEVFIISSFVYEYIKVCCNILQYITSYNENANNIKPFLFPFKEI